MTALAGLLAGATPPGAYRWPTAPPSYDAGRVVRVAGRAGWRATRLVAGGLGGRADLVASLGDALEVSGLHGHNLDALEERVRALPARPPLLVVCDDWADLAAEHPRATRGALRVVTAHEEAPTVVLLLGDGPDLGLPLLDRR
ncbi:hypothetical protein ENKNEFLB_03233 [Nocardioides aquaticus]|uniref:Barstar (barnase inhibitor) domain-containing protein n=1 Tax=Nocardioides aquaticus TaxID=160826 RepID=A0ABX8EJX3_9ACTN|nr:barstar family protein [Nocardioides aquaticus]QVT80832.1 hypothetical protein ENKNEFLB_03233 [Nocardioides aquaticus]